MTTPNRTEALGPADSVITTSGKSLVIVALVALLFLGAAAVAGWVAAFSLVALRSTQDELAEVRKSAHLIEAIRIAEHEQLTECKGEIKRIDKLFEVSRQKPGAPQGIGGQLR